MTDHDVSPLFYPYTRARTRNGPMGDDASSGVMRHGPRLGPDGGQNAADAPPPVRLPRCADYAPELAALYRAIVDLPARPMPTAPVLPEVIRFDPDADLARPGTVYSGLLDDLRSGHLAELRRRHPPMTAEARATRYARDGALGGAQTLALAAALAQRDEDERPRFRA